MSTINAQLFREMSDELLPTVRDTVIPIGVYDTNGNDPQPIGTGTLFEVADTKFIVSAAHVIEEVDKRSGMVCAFIPGETGEHGTRLTPVPITGNSHHFSDPADVAVLELSQETAEAFAGSRFLRLCDVELRAEALGCGWVCGFPYEYIRTLDAVSRGLEPLTLATSIQRHDGSGLANFDPLAHFILDANRSSFGWSDGSGPANLPDQFGGISGCAVWQTWWPSRGRLDERRARGVKVVGVQTSHYRGPSLIKATHWGVVAELIRQAFPKLRPVLGMHFGPGFAQ